jgi:hypothetical protein
MSFSIKWRRTPPACKAHTILQKMFQEEKISADASPANVYKPTWSQATRQNILSATILWRQSITSEAWYVLTHCFVALTNILSIFWLLYCLLFDYHSFIFNIFDNAFYRVVFLFFIFYFLPVLK